MPKIKDPSNVMPRITLYQIVEVHPSRDLNGNISRIVIYMINAKYKNSEFKKKVSIPIHDFGHIFGEGPDVNRDDMSLIGRYVELQEFFNFVEVEDIAEYGIHNP